MLFPEPRETESKPRGDFLKREDVQSLGLLLLLVGLGFLFPGGRCWIFLRLDGRRLGLFRGDAGCLFGRKREDGSRAAHDDILELAEFLLGPIGPAGNASVDERDGLGGAEADERAEVAAEVVARECVEGFVERLRAERIGAQRRVRRIHVAVVKAQRKELRDAIDERDGEQQREECGKPGAFQHARILSRLPEKRAKISAVTG